jgi:hypothetical protein
MGIQL